MSPNGKEGMANSVDPDQTAEEQSDLGLHCLPRPVCLKTYENYGRCSIIYSLTECLTLHDHQRY